MAWWSYTSLNALITNNKVLSTASLELTHLIQESFQYYQIQNEWYSSSFFYSDPRHLIYNWLVFTYLLHEQKSNYQLYKNEEK